MKPGDRVWYWTKRAGSGAYKKHGTVVTVNGDNARVRDDNVRKKPEDVPVFAVSVARLHLKEAE